MTALPHSAGMTSTTTAPVPLATVLTRRVFHVRELEKLDVSQSTSYRRSRADGPWTRLAPGIVLAAPDPPTTDDYIQAALIHAGPTAVITGMHAARLHGLKSPPQDAPVHVLIPHSRRLQSYPSIKIERTIRMPEPEIKDGIPVAPLARAVMDGARTWQTRKTTEELLIDTIQNGYGCQPNRLIEEMELGSRRGTGLPREILRGMTAELRSIPELAAFKLLRSTDLPTPAWNVHLFGADGSYVGCPDVWFDEVGLAVELDSYEFHFSKAGYASTTKRNIRYAANGVLVVQILPSRLTKAPESVVADIKAAYCAAARQGRPSVVTRARTPMPGCANPKPSSLDKVEHG